MGRLSFIYTSKSKNRQPFDNTYLTIFKFIYPPVYALFDDDFIQYKRRALSLEGSNPAFVIRELEAIPSILLN